MNIIGVDPGQTRKNPCAVVALRYQPDVQLIGSGLLWPARNQQFALWLWSVAEFISGLASLHRVSAVVVEWPYAGDNVQSALKLAAVTGAVACAAGRRGLPYYTVAPAEAKRALTGHASAGKQMMIDAVQVYYRETLTKDLADAFGIALAGGARHAQEQLLIKLREYK